MALYSDGMMPTLPKLLFSFLAAGVPLLLAQSAPVSKPEILFICEHGAAKSIIAAAEFNKLAAQRGLPHRAVARGTNPDESFSQSTLAGLKKDGLPEPQGKPQTVTAADVNRAFRVVTLGCQLPEAADRSKKAVDWSDISSPGKDYDSARKDIDRHLEKLLDELSASAEKQLPKR